MTVSTALAFLAAGLVAGLLALVLLEALLRRFRFDPTKFYVRLPGFQVIFRPNPRGTPGLERDSLITVHRFGFRGRRPPLMASPRFLSIGGSVTELPALNDEDTWSGQLERLLLTKFPRAWVGNMGKGGTHSEINVMQLKHVLPRLPKVDTAFILVGLNDMLFDLSIHLPRGLNENWKLAQGFMYMPPSNPSWAGRSATCHLAKTMLGSKKPVDVQIVEVGTMYESFKERRAKVHPSDFITEVPDLTAHLHNFRQNLSQIYALLSRDKIACVLLTHPSLWKDDLTEREKPWLYAGGVGSPNEWFKNANNKWYDWPVLWTILESYNDVTRQFAAEHRLTLVDLSRELPKDVENFYDDFHLTPTGCAGAAKLIFDQVFRSR